MFSSYYIQYFMDPEIISIISKSWYFYNIFFSYSFICKILLIHLVHSLSVYGPVYIKSCNLDGVLLFSLKKKKLLLQGLQITVSIVFKKQIVLINQYLEHRMIMWNEWMWKKIKCSMICMKQHGAVMLH